MRELPTGTVTFLFTDVEGSTKLLHELGAERYAEVLAEHRRVLRDAFVRHGGVEVDTQGDAFFVAFPHAPSALAAAEDAQVRLAGGPISVRMGLHTGTPHVTGDGYVGQDVHLGARVASAGHGGQVLISAASRAALDPGAGPVLAELGEHRLKDFDQPVAIFQLGDRRFPPLKTISNTNLPRPASSFVGREREVAEVSALVRDDARLVTMTGPGGSGKTRLAIEAAAELVPDFTGGVFWVPLAATNDPALVSPAIARAIGGDGELAKIVGARELLLVVDNLEQVIAAAPDLAALVEACPNLRLLVTSRVLLRVRGEVEYEVEPLADVEGVALFSERSRLPETDAVDELCRRLDNMPLALELAAARTKVLSPEQILERLSQRLDLFTGGRDSDPRQQTLRATIEWSYELLSEDERALFARLAVFPGGCTLEAAESVCDAGLDVLQSLIEKSLLRRTEERYWMLETIREYASERLEASGEGEALRRRLAEWLLALALSANFQLESEGDERHDLVVSELSNIRAAMTWAIAADPELGARVLLALEQFWAFRSPFEARRWLDELLARGPFSDELQARLLAIYGGLIWLAGDFEEGGRHVREATELFRKLGDERGVALMLPRLAQDANLAGDRAGARALCEEALSVGREIGFEKPIAEALLILAYLEMDDGRLDEAMRLADEAAAHAAAIGWRWWEVSALLRAAECAVRLRGPLEDGGRVRRGLAAAYEIGDRQHTVYLLALLAWAAAAAADAERAGRLWGAIEAETERGPIGQWEAEREEYALHLAAVSGPAFDHGVADGRAMTLEQTVEYGLSVDSPE